MPTTLCTGCESVPARLDTKARRDSFRRRGRAYCSDACRDAWVAADSSTRMAATNRAHASARMTERNPMRSEESRAKMAAALVGRRPTIRGGNGTGPSPAEAALADALGWELGFVIPLGRRMPGRPTHYKLDLALPERLLAVEVDGRSHLAVARLAADARKEAVLRGLGWRLFRLTNGEVLADSAAAAARVTAWADA